MFADDAYFDNTTFKDFAGFDDVNFGGKAAFVGATFEGYTAFKKANFQQASFFTVIHSKRAFSLEDAQFQKVPDFIQVLAQIAARADRNCAYCDWDRDLGAGKSKDASWALKG